MTQFITIRREGDSFAVQVDTDQAGLDLPDDFFNNPLETGEYISWREKTIKQNPSTRPNRSGVGGTVVYEGVVIRRG